MRIRKRDPGSSERETGGAARDLLPGDLLNLILGGTLTRWPRPVLAVLEVGAIAAGVAWVASTFRSLNVHSALVPAHGADALLSLVTLLAVVVSLPFAAVSVASFLVRRRHLLPNDLILLVDGLAVAVGVSLGSGAIRLG